MLSHIREGLVDRIAKLVERKGFCETDFPLRFKKIPESSR